MPESVLDLDDFRALLDHASDGVPPPPEWSLLADARNHLVRGEHRTAVVDAATAAEIALSDHLVKALSVVNADLARRVIDRATLGRLVEYAGVQSTPVPVTHGLVRVRNGVVHRGETPTSEEAATAVAIVEALVEHLALGGLVRIEMARLNRAVVVDHRRVHDVAAEHLDRRALGTPRDAPPGI